MKIAAAYIRVSTDDQVEYSPDSQLKAIRAYAKSNGMMIPEEYIYIDEGISGRTAEKRPAFMRMIGTAKQKGCEFETILLWKFSRFARNREDSILYKSMLRKQCGIDVVSVSENLGDDKTAVLIEALIEAMDEYYSINLAEEVRRGMTEKVSRGEPVCGAPYGYRMQNKAYVVDETEAAVVHRIYDDFQAGKPIYRIAQELNADGIQTKAGKRWENRTVEYILRNVAYIGKIAWNTSGRRRREYGLDSTMIVDGSHEPLISQEQFSAVQKQIAKNKATYVSHAHAGHGKEFALKGILRCSNCGGTLCSSRDDGVQCHRYTRGKCSVSHYVKLDKITPIVLDKMRQDMTAQQLPPSVLSRAESRTKTIDNRIQKQLAAERRKLERAKEAYMAGVDTIEEYRRNKADLSSRIAELERQAQAQTDEQSKAADLEAFRAGIADAVRIASSGDASEATKNEALRSVIESAVFDRAAESVEIFYK